MMVIKFCTAVNKDNAKLRNTGEVLRRVFLCECYAVYKSLGLVYY